MNDNQKASELLDRIFYSWDIVAPGSEGEDLRVTGSAYFSDRVTTSNNNRQFVTAKCAGIFRNGLSKAKLKTGGYNRLSNQRAKL